MAEKEDFARLGSGGTTTTSGAAIAAEGLSCLWHPLSTENSAMISIYGPSPLATKIGGIVTVPVSIEVVLGILGILGVLLSIRGALVLLGKAKVSGSRGAGVIVLAVVVLLVGGTDFLLGIILGLFGGAVEIAYSK